VIHKDKLKAAFLLNVGSNEDEANTSWPTWGGTILNNQPKLDYYG